MYQPLHNYVLVEKEEEKKETTGGIILPDTANKPLLTKGKVISSGPGAIQNGELVPTAVKEGDVILWENYNDRGKINLEGRILYLLRDIDINIKIV
jgi:chaperonin GroES